MKKNKAVFDHLLQSYAQKKKDAKLYAYIIYAYNDDDDEDDDTFQIYTYSVISSMHAYLRFYNHTYLHFLY